MRVSGKPRCPARRDGHPARSLRPRPLQTFAPLQRDAGGAIAGTVTEGVGPIHACSTAPSCRVDVAKDFGYCTNVLVGEAALQIVIDSSAILAVLLREPRREALIAATSSATLLTPASTPWEIGNALVAGWRRKRLNQGQIAEAWASFQSVSLRLVDVDVSKSLRLAVDHGLYAYDAYVLEAALVRRVPLLTLDQALARAAEKAGVANLEV